MKTFRLSLFKTLNTYFPFHIENVINDIEKEFHFLSRDIEFVDHSNNPMDKFLKDAIFFLSLFKVLKNEGFNFEQIKSISLKIADLSYSRRSKLNLFEFKSLINFKIKKTFLNKNINIKTHSDGFKGHLIYVQTHTELLISGFDITECGICKLFEKHDLNECIPLMCQIEKLFLLKNAFVFSEKSSINGHLSCEFKINALDT